jgi:O-6-methylguanine DNA methyltransferase
MSTQSPCESGVVTQGARVVFKTQWGWIGLAGSERGLCAVVLPQPARKAVELSLGRRFGVTGCRPAADESSRFAQASQLVVASAARQLREYLAGKRRTLDVPVDLRGGSPFQRRVWRAILSIPYGRVRSYKWVASRVGGAGYARAVGHALGANPVPIVIPCHRVVAHDASLGGFTGGIQVKRRLLALEGILQQLNHS